MYKCIIFDIDGTILDTEKAVIGSLQKLLKQEKGIEYAPEELTFALGIPGSISLKRLGVKEVEKASLKWNEYLKDFYNQIILFPEIDAVIKQIRGQQICTGIVTSKTRQELVDDFYPFGLQNDFDYIVCANDTAKHKPEPDPILKCIELTKSKPSETIYIGDTIYDMQCANNAGIDFALALWGAKNHTLDAQYKLNHPREILNLTK